MLNKLKKIFFKQNKNSKKIYPLKIDKISSYKKYIEYIEKSKKEIEEIYNFEKNLIPEKEKKFFFNGFCFVCKKEVDFLVDFKYSYKVDNILIPNWRERLVCPHCNFNNRMRATIHIFLQECLPKPNSTIYITEQTTPMFKWLKSSFNEVYGSEYLGSNVELGKFNNKNIRNEDLTKLTFSNNKFDYILSFDVFEHIPEYKKALKECYRCLKSNGVLFFSIPFVINSEKNIVRACITENNEIKCILPPEYHGDPVNPEGCLCFYHFGWELLKDLKDVGFKDSTALIYWSKEFAYLGGKQILFMARK